MDTRRKAKGTMHHLRQDLSLKIQIYENAPKLLLSMPRSTPAQKVIVLRGYCELCGLSQHFSNPTHVLVTIYDEFKSAREIPRGAHGGAQFSSKIFDFTSHTNPLREIST